MNKSIMAMLLFMPLIISAKEPSNFSEKSGSGNENVSFVDLIKNPAHFEGKYIKFSSYLMFDAIGNSYLFENETSVNKDFLHVLDVGSKPYTKISELNKVAPGHCVIVWGKFDAYQKSDIITGYARSRSGIVIVDQMKPCN